MFQLLRFVMPLLPEDKPHHLLGIGDIPSINECVPLGVDTFDSSHPTKAARHGLLFTKKGNVRVMQIRNALTFRPIEDNCACYTCQNYTIAYLHHLFKAHELTFFSLATIHNVHFMVQLMKQMQEKILNDEI